MKYFVEVNGRELQVELVEHLGELHVAVDGERVALDYQEVDQLGQISLIRDDYSFAVSIQGAWNEFAVTIAGHLFGVVIEDERERAAHAAEREIAGRGGLVKSVMPGIVVTLLAAPGDTVEPGQPLLILEAMKMQNEITAEVAGVVQKIHVTEGQAVSGGATLVTIAAPAD